MEEFSIFKSIFMRPYKMLQRSCQSIHRNLGNFIFPFQESFRSYFISLEFNVKIIILCMNNIELLMVLKYCLQGLELFNY